MKVEIKLRVWLMRAICLLVLVGWLLFDGPAIAATDAAPSTGCEVIALQHGWEVQNGRRVFNEADIRAVSFQIDTPVYTAATGDTRAQRSLRFSEHVIIVDPGEGTGRIKVKDIGGQPLGWLNRGDVLCRLKPMTDPETGLYRRAVVRTAPDVQGKPQEKEVYQSLDKRCEGGNRACVKVSRFQWYFIYAEMQDQYLISEAPALGNSTLRLLGWLPKGDAIPWNTALGLRPAEQLEHRKGPHNESEDYVCAYASVADLNSHTGCKEILGGMRWFNLDARLAVLQENKAGHYYQVAFSNAFRNPDQSSSDGASVAEGLKFVDVFFVIDGTKSMQPVIDGVKSIVGKLAQKVKSKVAQGGIVRFGFRVYRDSIRGGQDGVENSEHLVLPNSCEKTNESEFTKALETVNAFEPPGDDDYPENLFAGLMQASADMYACPDHAKIVFVIGDHGYDPEKQKLRGFKWYNEAQVAAVFKKGLRFKTQPIVIFIQTPSESNNLAAVPATHKVKYDAAYELFRRQGNDILKLIYDGSGMETASQNFVALPEGDISSAVVDNTVARVDEFFRPDVVAQIMTRLSAGQSLVDIIQSLQGNSELNIPIRYLQFVERSLCDRLGERCHQSVFETVNTAYVPTDDVLIPEVMLTRDQLDRWLEILGKFNAAMSRVLSSQQERARIVNALLQDIGDVLQYTIPNNQTELGKFLQFQGGLPAAANSKLMQYSPVELASSTKIPPCEVDYLVQYASRKYEILKLIVEGEGRYLPVYQESRWPDGACPGISAKGKNIPNISGQIQPGRLNPPTGGTDYTFLRRLPNRGAIYWIPVRYLP
jgi:hypothetical protein